MAKSRRPQNFKLNRNARPARKTWKKGAILTARFSKVRRTILLLLFASFLFFLLDFLKVPFIRNLKSQLTDAAVFVVQSVLVPIQKVEELYSSIHDLFSLQEEVKHLRQQKTLLEKALYKASHHAIENHYLKLQNHLIVPRPSEYKTSIVLGYPGQPYIRNILIRGGRKDGLRDDMPLLNHQGLVGRIIQANDDTSFGLMITDINSRVPVSLKPSLAHAILKGNNTSAPTLAYSEPSKLKVGEVVVTSGEGGVFPPGLPVGEVSEITEEAVKVRPYAALRDLHYVQAWSPPSSQETTL